MNEQPWGLVDSSFPYSFEQYETLAKVTLAITILSMVGSLITIAFYAIFVYKKGAMADRVSLRCVATASVVNLADAVMNLTMIVYKGTIVPCSVLAILIQFTDVLGACLLSTIGVNLVLVFVIKVKRSCILERFYYPFSIIYSLTTMIIPIYEESKMNHEDGRRKVDCWIYNNFTHRHAHFDSWIYFYSLIFFIMLVGLVCAIIAAIKLLREEYRNHKIIHGSSLADTNNGLRFSESNAYRVITRCIIYSSVPFFCHIFGFSLHLAGVASRVVPIGFTFVYAVMSVAEGTMTTLVFFSEPAVCDYIREVLRTWYQKYVEEFRIIERPEDRRRSSVSISSGESLQPKLQEYNIKSSLPRMQARSPRAFYETTAKSNLAAQQQQDLGDPSFLQVPISSDADSASLYSTSTSTVSSKMSSPDSNTRSVPMRRVRPNSPAYHRISRRSLLHRSCPAILTSDDEKDIPEPDYYVIETPDTADDEVYIPYRFPRLARIVHWILVRFAPDNQHDPQPNGDNPPPPNAIVIDPRS